METIYIDSQQYEELIKAIYGISERLNTIITDSHNYFYFALVVVVFIGMAKLISSLMEPLVIDY